MIKKRYIIVLSVSILLLLGVSLLVSLLKVTNDKNIIAVKKFTPEFLSATELNSFGIATITKAEVIKRDQTGKVIIYKIIGNDNDIVNPAEVKPIVSN